MSAGITLGGDVEKLRRFLDWGSTHFPLTVARAMRRAAVIVERKLRENVSGGVLNRRTSTLARSVGTVEEDGGHVQRVGATAFYITTHEGQVKPALLEGDHVVIRPVRAKRLAFQPVRGGPMVFARQVRIPIRRPVGVTFDEAGGPAMEEAAATLRRVLDAGGEQA